MIEEEVGRGDRMGLRMAEGTEKGREGEGRLRDGDNLSGNSKDQK